MKSHRRWLELTLVVIAVALVVFWFNKTPQPSKSDTSSSFENLVALEGQTVPDITETHRVLVETDAGDFTLELYPQAAPNAVERYLELVEVGFYNNTPVSRVVDGFVTQFGINHQMKDWKDKHFDDDPSLFQLLPGTIAFAKAGRNTNSTQVFVNLTENNRLTDPSMNFTIFGQVIDGMSTVEKLESGGDPGMGLDQAALWKDGSYLEGLATKPNMIIKMTLIKS